MRDWGRGAGVGMERLSWKAQEGAELEGCRRGRLLVDTEGPFVSGVCVCVGVGELGVGGWEVMLV